METNKYVFSGHESFPCKSLWLKRGYDFVTNGNDFNSSNAVVELGVGKNMVSSIRYWLKSFSITKDDNLTSIGNYLFDDLNGRDKYIEDLGTLWLLHFLLVFSGEATIYNWLFLKVQKERKVFDRSQVQSAVQRYMVEAGKVKLFNPNTTRKDIGVLIQNYVQPSKIRSFEDYSTLLLDLDLISTYDDKTYFFNIEGKRSVDPNIFLYSLLKIKGEDNTISYDVLQDLGLIYCMNDLELISMLKSIAGIYSSYVNYSDVAGIRQVQFIQELNPFEVLDNYYGKK